MAIIHQEDLLAWLRRKADRGELYQKYLRRESLSDSIQTPVHHISRTISPDNFQELSDWIAEWNRFKRTCPEVTIDTSRKRIANIGVFDLPNRCTLPAEKAAALIGKTTEACRFAQAVQRTREEVPFLTEWVVEHPKWFTDAKNMAKLPSFLRVGKWMQGRDMQEEELNSLREVLIPGVDTKFLEKNMAKVRSMHQFLTGERLENRQDFLDAVGIEAYPEDGDFVKIRMPDPACRIGNLSVISVLSSELARLPLHPDAVFLIENKATFYHFPAVQNSIIIFGSGYAATGQMQGIPLLQDARLYYWSDLDRDGFRMLDYLRSRYPKLRSLFMDIEAARAGESSAVPDEGTQKVSLHHLTEPEQEAFDLLSRDGRRIEQERFPWKFAKEWLRRQDFVLIE